MAKHENNGACLKCLEIKNKFPNFRSDLWDWFAGVQISIPEFHISCAGRGEDEQEALFMKKATRAHWKFSAHNWGAALDTFFLIPGSNNLWPSTKYDSLKKLGRIPQWVCWYGEIGSVFPELPHFEIRGWRTMKEKGELTLCENQGGAV
jgi:hypothetical protein